MTTELQVTSPSILHNMNDVERAARAMSASGFFKDAAQAAQAVVKILAGQELGFGAFASMTGVHIIQGKPTLSANLMAAAVKRTGKYNYRVLQQTDQLCEIEFYEDGKAVGKSQFTMDEAVRAQLTSNPTWKKYPSDMLFARAISRGQKRFAPDIFNGATVYTPDEMGAILDEEGNVVSSDAVKPLQIESASYRDKLVERYQKLMDRAEAAGVALLDWVLTENMTDEEIMELGVQLLSVTEKAEKENK